MTDHLELAERAAQAVRDLNHRTRGPDAFTGPAQLYRLVGELALLAGMLPQLLGQLEDWLNSEHDADRVRADNRGDPGPVVDAATVYLADAGDAAHDLARLLTCAQQHLAHLGATEPAPAAEHRCRREQDLADDAAGPATGWWDDNSRPAPWPDDFSDSDSDRRSAARDPADDDPHLRLAVGEPPF